MIHVVLLLALLGATDAVVAKTAAVPTNGVCANATVIRTVPSTISARSDDYNATGYVDQRPLNGICGVTTARGAWFRFAERLVGKRIYYLASFASCWGHHNVQVYTANSNTDCTTDGVRCVSSRTPSNNCYNLCSSIVVRTNATFVYLPFPTHERHKATKVAFAEKSFGSRCDRR
mmetsp:Transcript_11012/g.26578  ORF Transcript_11012/g.26578 Transcript_11012/m.26578 type:complete len:175 (-) Transcript_11012:79-603(-)|eukprot:CAMPEP_0198311354 /NCGR_PEP_ID=MMETSP1450-20131203/3099_1 /TAXON_ID=753684 ORGANISM="Madagascaria erythrocladiodes, Strain CCMP3234" /NCGR_SAMPLE_ID=MMETSP1450 /ASSEMBLY_ACC=CAM_ASM_001115 /LENGTH=174 /DNA_ID=CAMNT_0044014225 /DNA_START=79 /DNA_END=603 /DNA_ORIENTATION=-